MTEAAKRPRVLVVDDATYNREVLVQNLEDEYDLLEAADGLTGVSRARNEQPDIIPHGRVASRNRRVGGDQAAAA
jgi:CheY-like chemotaxis protein